MYNDVLVQALSVLRPMRRGVDTDFTHADRMWIHGMRGFLESLALAAMKRNKEPAVWELDTALSRLDGVRKFRPLSPEQALLIELNKVAKITRELSGGKAVTLYSKVNPATGSLAMDLVRQLDRLLT